MIHFNFKVTDEDAEAIVFAIRDVALRNDEYILEYMARTDLTNEQKNSYKKCLESNKEYMLGLIKKMTNSRVKEGEVDG